MPASASSSVLGSFDSSIAAVGPHLAHQHKFSTGGNYNGSNRQQKQPKRSWEVSNLNKHFKISSHANTYFDIFSRVGRQRPAKSSSRHNPATFH
jgi:hypothetical protein